jgi:hypothetical protein
MKSLFLLGVLTGALLLDVGWAGEAPTATLKIDSNKSGKNVPAFPHARHTEMQAMKGNCAACHHTQKKDEKPTACSTCHTQPEAKDAKTGAIGFKDAFHKKCLGCHQQQKEMPDLKKCKTCHG